MLPPVHKIRLYLYSTRPFRTNTQKRCPFPYRGLEGKSRKSRNSIYGLKILVYDELCNKYNIDCFCVDEPTYYQICEGKYYNDIGKQISEVLDKVEAKICNEY